MIRTTPEGRDIIEAFCHLETATADEVAERANVTKRTALKHLNQLADDGYAVRVGQGLSRSPWRFTLLETLKETDVLALSPQIPDELAEQISQARAADRELSSEKKMEGVQRRP